MKKNVKLIGIGHVKGEKNGQPYDFYQIHGVTKDEKVDGDAVICARISDNEVYDLCIGNEYIMFTHFYNGREVVDAVLR